MWHATRPVQWLSMNDLLLFLLSEASVDFDRISPMEIGRHVDAGPWMQTCWITMLLKLQNPSACASQIIAILMDCTSLF